MASRMAPSQFGDLMDWPSFWWGMFWGWASSGVVVILFLALVRGTADHWHDGVER